MGESYCDLLFFNYEFNCFVVIELKTRKIKKEDIGQLEYYINYVDKNMKKESFNPTIGVLVAKEGNYLVMKYCTNKNIYKTTYKIINEKEESENVVADDNVDINEDKDDKEMVVEEKKPQIFNGNDRPIAVMIDNHSGAWPQANLNKAYLVYEIIVEGGETRLMAVFKGQDLEKIGPIRSSRHYFLDYALENDAIYVHHGWSPQAQNDISALNVNNINGIQESSNNFWRVKDKKSPHNMFTSTTSILKIAERKGYATISDKKSVLNYIAGDVDLKEKYGIAEEQTENTSAESKAINATKIVIPHSTLQTVEYDYDENSKTYVRYARGKVQTDYITGENIQTKNIIITMCDKYTLADSEEKGRQGLKNIGTFDVYYITNGYAIPIKCEKESRTAQTQYKDLKVNAI